MKKFILSDLHIGHENAQYDVMDQALEYIQEKVQPGDQVLGLGDWFHMSERGFDYCLNHPMAHKFIDLARQIPTRLMPGNHDHALEKYLKHPELGNPLTPINLVGPFLENGIWYCHGHEFDPTVEYLPGWAPTFLNKFRHKITPSRLKQTTITEVYLLAVQVVHSRAIISLQNKARKERLIFKGVVMGHTHLPVRLESPDLIFLLNDGDMRHSSTFVVEDEDGFHLMHWEQAMNKWRTTLVQRP